MARRSPILVTALFVSLVASAKAADPSRAPRVRVRNPALELLFATALDRSPTFQALVRELEASDVIVYIDRNLRLRPSIRGGITFVTAGEGVRYLNVWLNPRYTGPQMMATLGHELQHAVEVARAPEVTTAEAFARHYRHIGVRGESDNWDTAAARHAGRLVARELAQSDRETLADSDAGSAAAPSGTSARNGRAGEQVCQAPHPKFSPGG
jgi:hypothetical protein